MAHPDLPVEKRNDFIARCYANSERLKLLLEDVATLTRLDDGSNMIEIAMTDLCHVIRDTVYQKEPDIEQAGMKAVVDIPDSIMLRGNELLLGMLFANLLTNAIKYSSGTKIEILYTGESDGVHHFIFRDDGVGVPEDALEHIFERFSGLTRVVRANSAVPGWASPWCVTLPASTEETLLPATSSLTDWNSASLSAMPRRGSDRSVLCHGHYKRTRPRQFILAQPCPFI